MNSYSKITSKLILLFMLNFFVFPIYANDWLLDKTISDVVEKCKDAKGALGDYRIDREMGEGITDAQKICLKYSCIAEDDSKLKRGKSKEQVRKVGVVIGGEICPSSQAEINYLADRFKKLKKLDYYNCFSKCSDDFTDRSCVRCLSKSDELAGCELSKDYQTIDCPTGSYIFNKGVDDAMRKIKKSPRYRNSHRVNSVHGN